MAIKSDDATEDTSGSAEVGRDDTAELIAQADAAADQELPDEDIAVAVAEDAVSSDDPDHLSERNVEVMELLREPEVFDSETPEIQTVLEAVDEDDVTAAVDILPDNVRVAHPDYGPELKVIQESLQDSVASTQSLSEKIDAVSSSSDGLVKQLNALALNYELLTAEMETISTDAHSKSVLSKTFLVISSLIIVLLVVFQIYMFTSLIKTERLQNASGATVLENITGLNNKMAAYDKNLTKALEVQPKQEAVQAHTAAVEGAGHGVSGYMETAPVSPTPVLEKLNKLRSGLPEKKLIRNESGDWFVYNKKSNESVSDVDIIEALNESYIKIGRTLTPTVPMPQHKALCILKPDGKGGTKVMMTKEFVQ
ncbi:MAG: hypothetical protein ACYDG4_15895 [Desulfuromonadaceae bacterium]